MQIREFYSDDVIKIKFFKFWNLLEFLKEQHLKAYLPKTSIVGQIVSEMLVQFYSGDSIPREIHMQWTGNINNMEVIIFAILSHTLHLVLTMLVLFSRDEKIVINISLPQSFAVLWNSLLSLKDLTWVAMSLKNL